MLEVYLVAFFLGRAVPAAGFWHSFVFLYTGSYNWSLFFAYSWLISKLLWTLSDGHTCWDGFNCVRWRVQKVDHFIGSNPTMIMGVGIQTVCAACLPCSQVIRAPGNKVSCMWECVCIWCGPGITVAFDCFAVYSSVFFLLVIRGVASLISAQTLQVSAPLNSQPMDGYRKGRATPICTWSPAQSGSWDMLHVGLEHVMSLQVILHMLWVTGVLV